MRTIVYDTITYSRPILKDSVVVRYVTELLPAKEKHEGGDVGKTEPPHDSVEVEIPITQKVYEDSLYTAYVSGYRPQLDSLVLYTSKEQITVSKHRTKENRWSVGLQAGYGITLKGTPQFAPYIGIGVSYNLFNK